MSTISSVKAEKIFYIVLRGINSRGRGVILLVAWIFLLVLSFLT